jgi:LmbE family N-acetylglucosaminyl deacetylase
LNFNISFLNENPMDIPFEDRLILAVLNEIEKNSIDTLIIPWEGDVNKDHQTVAKIGIAASRRIPRVLHGQINYFLHNFFCPNFFVDISDYFERKVVALEKYESVWRSKCKDWTEFLRATHTYYGKMIGVRMAEGFITHKYLY